MKQFFFQAGLILWSTASIQSFVSLKEAQWMTTMLQSMAFTNVWMLLNYFRVLNSGWPMQLMGDGTFNFAEIDGG